MSTFPSGEQFDIQHFENAGVRVFTGRFVGEVDKFSVPEHVVVLSHSNFKPIGGAPVERWKIGDVCFVPKNYTQSGRMDEVAELTAIRLNDDLFTKVAEDHIDHDRIDFRYADITGPTTKSLAGTLEHVATTEGYREWPLIIENTALALAAATVRKLSPKASVAFDRFSALSAARRRRVVDFIDNNMHRQITLSEMAAVASLSTFHFCRRFKAATGQTPLRYIAERRAVEAKKQLRSTDTPLAQVALDCGYTGQSHFTTAFKAVTGVTPGAYRKALGKAILLVGLFGLCMLHDTQSHACVVDLLASTIHEIGVEIVETAVEIEDFLDSD